MADRGSPPRGWGKPQHHGLGVQRHRFTPTRVGKTSKPSFPTSLSTVHPHAGGENFLAGFLGCVSIGSPPRGWGKRGGKWRLRQWLGSPPRGWGKHHR